jgi:hypothetical protein
MVFSLPAFAVAGKSNNKKQDIVKKREIRERFMLLLFDNQI